MKPKAKESREPKDVEKKSLGDTENLDLAVPKGDRWLVFGFLIFCLGQFELSFQQQSQRVLIYIGSQQICVSSIIFLDQTYLEMEFHQFNSTNRHWGHHGECEDSREINMNNCLCPQGSHLEGNTDFTALYSHTTIHLVIERLWE